MDTTASETELDLLAPLERLFGFAAFRPDQEQVVRLAVRGRDTLAIMPTGSGKSLCYQLAAMLRPTPTLVVSPLIALMKNQLDGLPPEVARQATFINSSLPMEEALRRLEGIAAGEYRLVYAAPERLRQRRFVHALRGIEPGLVVIDEVHCVSMWGHDFRPDYLFIARALEELGRPAVLGLTATATPETERDIGACLGRELEVVRSSVARPNLRFEVRHVANEEERQRAALDAAQRLAGQGVVYVRARDRAEEVARLLRSHHISAEHYHAGLEPGERAATQDRFIANRTRVIVATTAFGMGIDKPDIRWILVYNFPHSLEEYVQMVGRAGRDGLPSTCTLFASRADASNLRRFVKRDVPEIDHLRAVYAVLRKPSGDGWEDDCVEITRQELAARAGLPEEVDPRVLVGMLERAGLVRRDYDAGPAMRVELLPTAREAAKGVPTLLTEYERQALGRVRRMLAFADEDACRHDQVARHFGERAAVPCGACDVCAPEESEAPAAPAPREARVLPDDVGGTILGALDGLPFPVGVRGLVGTLRGAVGAPRTARGSEHYGAFEGTPEGTVKRWVEELVASGHLGPYEEDGYRLLRVLRRHDPPPLGAAARSAAIHAASADQPLHPAAAALYDALCRWRLTRAQEIDKPAFVVLNNRTLRALALERPATLGALSGIDGIGEAKLARYGSELLKLIRDTGAPDGEEPVPPAASGSGGG